jgi:mycobactin lysine-N-oxygenase
MVQQNLAVLGAGPKAAALAAKAYCLQQEGVAVSVSVFERHEIGANWSGRYGYTDGRQRLCTPAERDLGFPYLPTFGANVVELMQSRFSWSAFLISQANEGNGYANWVNRGRHPPAHSKFAQYLQFAFAKAEVTPFCGRIVQIVDEGGTWGVRQIDAASRDVVEYQGFHGIVFTGPGPNSRLLPKVSDPRVLSGVDFWSRLAHIRKLVAKLKEEPIVIIGGGGTAAAVTAWFIRNGVRDHPIVLLNNQAMLFTRTTNFFENSLFDDEETWKALQPGDRGEFTRRLNRGVVWETVTELLSEAENLTLMPGAADAIRHVSNPRRQSVKTVDVQYTNALGTSSLPAGIVIDATGFDPWAFAAVTPSDMRIELEPSRRSDLKKTMKSDLSLPLDAWPRVHAPNLAEAVGPGYGSLMVLGSMADRILQPYYDAALA